MGNLRSSSGAFLLAAVGTLAMSACLLQADGEGDPSLLQADGALSDDASLDALIPATDGGSDSGSDARLDAAAEADVTHDQDADPADAGVDASEDAGLDAPEDAGLDAPEDASLDTAGDALDERDASDDSAADAADASADVHDELDAEVDAELDAADDGPDEEAGQEGGVCQPGMDMCDRDCDGEIAQHCGGADCCDDDDRVHTGQTSWFDQPNNCLQFDYNCDGRDEGRWGEGEECWWLLWCHYDRGYVDGVPACGQGAKFVDDCSSLCESEHEWVRQMCR